MTIRSNWQAKAPAPPLIGLALAFAGVLAAADLPKAETILDKYVEVTGGKAAYAKIHSHVIAGTMEFPAMGLKGKMTIYAAEPGKQYVEMNFEGVGKMQEGSDGEVAWANSAMQGPRIKEGGEKAESLLRAKFNGELNWRNLYKTVETVALETVDGKQCYKVVATPKSGNPRTLWYDQDSNLMVKVSAVTETPQGDIQSDTSVSDYRKVGDLLVPHKMMIKAGPMEIAMTIDSVQVNPEIPMNTFEMPDEVKALLKKP
jgi:outer membrane lipoprotein-sorting protein